MFFELFVSESHQHTDIAWKLLELSEARPRLSLFSNKILIRKKKRKD